MSVDLATIVEALPASNWWTLAGLALAILLIPGIMKMRRAFHVWRYERRRAREGIWPEERYAAAVDIGEEVPGVDWRGGALGLLVAAFVTAIPTILLALELPEWWVYALILGWLFLSAVYAWWVQENAPPPAPGDEPDRRPNEVPFEAWAGFLAALAMVGCVLLVVWLF